MKFTEDQLTIRQRARDFAGSELAPIAARIDRDEMIPREIIRKMAENGFTALNVPKAFGGLELDTVCRVLVISELARHCTSAAEVISVHTLVNDIFLKHGTDEQKQRYLTAAAEGKLGAFSLTEPDAGSDTAKIRAIADGDSYILSGSKCFVSNMGPNGGDFVIVIAETRPDLGDKGMSAIVVDRDTPGFIIGKSEKKMGLRGADISELIFEDCRVPRTNLIGSEGEGFQIAMQAVDSGCIGMAAQALGLSNAAVADSIQYMNECVRFGEPIAKNQGLQWYLADMATRTTAAWSLVLEAAQTADDGAPLSKLAAMCKYFAAENCIWITNQALQIHGSYGYTRDYPIERMCRDARAIPIYCGTSEVQKTVIAREAMARYIELQK